MLWLLVTWQLGTSAENSSVSGAHLIRSCNRPAYDVQAAEGHRHRSMFASVCWGVLLTMFMFMEFGGHKCSRATSGAPQFEASAHEGSVSTRAWHWKIVDGLACFWPKPKVGVIHIHYTADIMSCAESRSVVVNIADGACFTVAFTRSCRLKSVGIACSGSASCMQVC